MVMNFLIPQQTSMGQIQKHCDLSESKKSLKNLPRPLIQIKSYGRMLRSLVSVSGGHAFKSRLGNLLALFRHDLSQSLETNTEIVA
jgi:hypothetical protein